MHKPGINDLYNRRGRQDQTPEMDMQPEDGNNPQMDDLPEDQVSLEPEADDAGLDNIEEKEADAGEASASRDVEGELREERLRMAAEMDNFKKRLQREHQEQMRYASEKVLSDLLPALDNLDLALQYGASHEACRDMMQGIEMTRKQLLDAVAKSGLVSVGAAGEAFDPAIHEAIGMEPNPDLEKGAVSKVLQRGYKLGDRLLRPAKVMVNN